MTKPSIVFFGTGPVAAKSLELLSEWADIEAIITKPKPAHHRGSFPVLDMAQALSLPVMEVSSKKELSEKIHGQKFSSQVGVLIDFGIIVTRDVIDYFPYGIINSHFSLLPEWRGADPITFAILSGQKRTGVSLMLINEKMDEGDLLTQADYNIRTDETSASLTSELITLSDSALKKIIPMYLDGATSPAPQLEVTIANSTTPTYSNKLTKADGLLDLSKSAATLEREIRAYLGWPGSRTTIADKDVTITKAHVATDVNNVENKTTFVSEKRLCLQTADGILVIDELKPAGKSNMSASAFLAGYGSKLN